MTKRNIAAAILTEATKYGIILDSYEELNNNNKHLDNYRKILDNCQTEAAETFLREVVYLLCKEGVCISLMDKRFDTKEMKAHKELRNTDATDEDKLGYTE
jgi:hypothetical protein